MVEIVFLPGADVDFQEAYVWYHDRSERAAARFEEAVDRALAQIAEAPLRWPVCDEKHRFRLLKRYPYSIVYRVEDEQVIVVAVAHAKRRPEYWKDRD